MFPPQNSHQNQWEKNHNRDLHELGHVGWQLHIPSLRGWDGSIFDGDWLDETWWNMMKYGSSIEYGCMLVYVPPNHPFVDICWLQFLCISSYWGTSFVETSKITKCIVELLGTTITINHSEKDRRSSGARPWVWGKPRMRWFDNPMVTPKVNDASRIM